MIIGVSGLTEDAQGNRGSAGAGKDEVADHLVRKHGFVKVALADEIKRIAMRLWDFTEEQLWGPSELRNIPDERYVVDQAAYEEFKKYLRGWKEAKEDRSIWNAAGISREKLEPLHKKAFLTPRHALQQIGTEVARAVDPDVWARFTMKVAKQLLNNEGVYQRTVGLVPGASVSYKGVVISDVRFPNETDYIRKNDGKVWRKKRQFATLPGKAATHASEVSLLDVPDSDFDAVFPDGELDHLYLLIDRVIDVYTGRIRPYDPEQADIPPFKRK